MLSLLYCAPILARIQSELKLELSSAIILVAWVWTLALRPISASAANAVVAIPATKSALAIFLKFINTPYKDFVRKFRNFMIFLKII